MEGAASVRRPGHDRQGVSHREDGRLSPKEKLSLKGKEGDGHGREKGSLDPRERSRSKGGLTRHKWCRSPTGCPDRRRLHSKGNQYQEEKGWGPPSPALGRAKDQSSSRAGLYSRAGSAHTPWRLQDQRSRSQSPVRASVRGRCQHSPEAEGCPTFPKRRRGPLSPEACVHAEALPSKLCNQMGALEVALGELRAPGGAYLPVPSRRTEPTASQRAWLTWQLVHAGAALHWALAALDSLLAAGTVPALPQPSRPWGP